MNLYALLIGINKYTTSPLQQCVGDVTKIESYLNTLQSNYDNVSIKKLINSSATKGNIVDSIQTLQANATDNDVVFLYYSGHGALEQSSNRFSDAHSGTIECIVCYGDEEEKSGTYLLADKELRYLFSKFKNDPNLITVFDCCHSGDITRSFTLQKNDDSRQRKINSIFSSRDYDNFIFSKEISEERIKSSKLTSLIPYKNAITISACMASESSWEDAKGGVFTRYLLQLLKARNNKLSYLDITKWAKISLKDITNKKQTPTISVQGKGKIDHYSSWLNLYPKQNLNENGQITFNNKKGWYYNKGQLFGIKKGTEITIKIDQNNEFTTKIIEVSLEDALIKDPLELGVSLDFKQSYQVNTTTTYTPLHLYINNLDKDQNAESLITSLCKELGNIELSSSISSSFFLTIFNQTVYISLPGTPYQPLAKQIDLLDSEDDVIYKTLERQLKSLLKWNYYSTLKNPDSGFDEIPIKIEIRSDHLQPWIDITGTGLDLMTIEHQKTRTDEYFQKYQINVSNISKETIYVTALLLSSDLGISADPLDNLTKELAPGQSIMFYEHRSAPYAGWSLDTYKEIYNWKQDWLRYLFIVNDQEDLTTSIPDMLQNGLLPPITHLGNLMGHGAISDFLPESPKWDVYSTDLNLINPSYNRISQKLLNELSWYTDHDILAPFINSIYTKQQSNGFIVDTVSDVPNVSEVSDIKSKSLENLKLKLGNYLDDKRRYRRYKKSKKLFPKQPIIVAEGDSWFLFPFLVKDTLDYVMEKYPLRSIAAAGDEIQNYRHSGQLLKEIQKERPKYVLISGGGNDIIGPAIVAILKNKMPSGLDPSSYLNEFYKKKTQDIEETYNYFFNRIHEFDYVKQVFVHGYDYVRTDHSQKTIKNGWVNRYLIEKGVTKIKDRTNIINYLIDEFNALLERVTKKHKNATYLDMRTLVKKDEWYDEIHPNDDGFKKVGDRFLEAINQLEYKYHENMQK
ncbi:hypothetical protein AWE51_03425 [Aquimarina aggregata]|uniref:Peptidase C14 caspase domain-containing protein n=1 Tax=Aquimarina aggregata TaxID=1642818 RepID=A0A163CKF9_9FLAO|nr:caspase family protein [Aquimarina aggregata]KZS42506.1 hypothetical protein AWE51_03425 [Aquimarina aggregata]